MVYLRMALCIGVLFGISKSYAVPNHYYVCSGNNTWDNSGLTVYTTSNCSAGTSLNLNSITWGNGDILTILNGATVVVYNNQQIGPNNNQPDVTLDVQGNLFFFNGATPGKVSLSTGSTVTLAVGSNLGCTTDGTTLSGSCSSSDQVNIGTTKFAGTDIVTINNQPKPSSVTSGTVLPVMLTSFSAVVSSQQVKLAWSTAAELNFDYFSLERSSDGITFSEITRVKGNGTTNEIHNYSFADTDPIIGRSYYRLTSVDFDNYQQTFEVVSVNYQGEKKFRVSPNPSDGSTLQLSFNFVNEANAQVIIYDNLGSVVGTYQVAGSNSVSIDNTLRSGVYLAKYTSPAFTRTERFIVK